MDNVNETDIVKVILLEMYMGIIFDMTLTMTLVLAFEKNS